MRVPVVPWPDFAIDWRPGEHVTIIGRTGFGKSHLLASLLGRRRYSVVLATKPADDTLTWYARAGWHRVESWPPPKWAERVLLWPRFRRPSDKPRQAEVIGDALDNIFAEGRWTVAADELHYLAADLGLASELVTYWQQGRSVGLSLIGATQRPAHVPLAAYSQARHLFLQRASDRRDLDRLAEISGEVDRDALRRLVLRLPKYAVAHVDNETGRVTVTRAPRRIPAPLDYQTEAA